jgi:hypothetical protein
MDRTASKTRVFPLIHRLATIGAIGVVTTIATIAMAQTSEPKQNTANSTDRTLSIRASAGRR